MPTLTQPLAGFAVDSRRKPDAINASQVTSGNADFFTVSSLTLTLVANSTDPFVYDVGGNPCQLQANVALAVTDTAHNFIWIDNTGAMGRSALPCVYDWTAPGAPATDQHWYDLGKSQMKSWSGAAWTSVSRIFIGYVRADGGSINARYACEPIGISPLDRYNFFGSGADGFLDVSAGTTTIDDFKRYTAVVVRGGTLNHSASVTSITTIQSQSVFVVLSSGTVNLNGQGVVGGTGGTGAGGAGNGGGEGGRGGGGGGGTNAGGAGGSGLQNNRSATSGGGSGGTAGGGAGGTGIAAISSLGSGRASFFMFPHGCSGGGGGGSGAAAGANGGAAGGAFEIKTPTFAVSSGATVSTNGAAGSNGPAANRGAGGGGAGGTLTIFFRNSFQSGTISVSGGAGGTSGGAGSGAGGAGGAGRSSLFQV
ncbi:MAG: protein product from [Planctomycetota bacterium]|nr:MAG: protein product from [Planctomycetota bacterium]